MGHYIALIKSAEHWLVIDDDEMQLIEEGDIGEFCFGATNEMLRLNPRNNQTGYILFYQSVPSSEVPPSAPAAASAFKGFTTNTIVPPPTPPNDPMQIDANHLPATKIPAAQQQQQHQQTPSATTPTQAAAVSSRESAAREYVPFAGQQQVYVAHNYYPQLQQQQQYRM